MTAIVVPHNFDQINTQVFAQSCTFSVCHTAGYASKAGHLDLQTDPYGALVDQLANNAKASGQGLLRVKPCDSVNSFLVIKLKLAQNESATTGYGNYMPDSSLHLPNEVIQAVSDWVDRGALKSEPATVTGHQCGLGADMGAHD